MNATAVRSIRILLAALAVIGLLAAGRAAAQAFPAKPITLLVGVAPGGAQDFIARNVAQQMARIIGQQVVVENRPGASGKIALHALLGQPRDGYAFAIVTAGAMAINPLVDRQIGYDPVGDFVPLTLAARTPLVVLVNPGLPVRSMKELVTYAKANADKMAYGSFGNASTANVWTEELLMTLGIAALHVPYKGESLALNELVAGQIQMMIVSGVAKPLVDSGKLVALATSGATRWALFPSTPTLGETGMSELVNYVNTPWLGFVASAGTPADVASRLSTALVEALRSPEVSGALAKSGFEVVASSPQDFRAVIRAELERNRKVLASGRIRLE